MMIFSEVIAKKMPIFSKYSIRRVPIKKYCLKIQSFRTISALKSTHRHMSAAPCRGGSLCPPEKRKNRCDAYVAPSNTVYSFLQLCVERAAAKKKRERDKSLSVSFL